jgi:GntR family transcriptional regulator of vanillate catabolism
MAMSTQYETVLQRLRAGIVGGTWRAGERLREIHVADQLGVSRTPVRAALASLAQEGLLRYTPQRGFVVRDFGEQAILDAVEVRGRLEALACETLARKGLPDTLRDTLRANLAATERLAGSALGEAELAEWPALNDVFHAAIVEGAGNETLGRLLAEIATIPLAAPRSFMLSAQEPERACSLIRQSLLMHGLVLEALEQGEAERAGLLMREHVHQGWRRLGARLRAERREA